MIDRCTPSWTWTLAGMDKWQNPRRSESGQQMDSHSGAESGVADMTLNLACMDFGRSKLDGGQWHHQGTHNICGNQCPGSYSTPYYTTASCNVYASHVQGLYAIVTTLTSCMNTNIGKRLSCVHTHSSYSHRGCSWAQDYVLVCTHCTK